MTRVELKEKAKESLKGKWGESIKIYLIYLLISFVVGLVEGFILGLLNVSEQTSALLTDATSLILSALFMLGMASFYLKIARNEEVTYKELFSKTNMFVATLLVMLLVYVFTFLWSLLFIIPGIIAAISYSQVYYIMLDNPELKTSEVVKMSKEMMKGHKMDYFLLTLSFLGWGILCLLTFGIGFLWLIPYMNVTTVNFYDSIRSK